MTPEDFVIEYRPVLIETLRRYLAGNVTHSAASECAWSIIEAWNKFDISAQAKYAPGERVLWSTVWAVQHLAGEDHWSDGTVQRDLPSLLALLESGEELPPGWQGNRP